MSDEPSAKPAAPIRARRWSGSTSTPPPPRPYRFALRLIGIPAAAVAGVLIYQGLRSRLFLPECDSNGAKHTLADMLRQYRLEPVSYEPIKTVSRTKDEVVCNAVLPLPDGGDVAIDYKFYWDGGTATMKYSVMRQAPTTPPTR